MAILAVGDEPEFFNNFFTGNTQTTTRDAGQRGGVSASTSGTTRWELHHSSVSEVWVRYRSYFSSAATSTTNPILEFFNSANNRPVFQIIRSAAWTTARIDCTARFLSTAPSTFTNITTIDMPITENPGVDVVVQFRRGTSGLLRIWINGFMIIDVSGTFNSVDTTWDRLRLYSPSTAANWFGGVIVADENLVGFEIDHLSPSGAGFHTQWAGSAANLADATGAPAVDAATDINTNAVGQRSTFAYDDMITLNEAREIAGVAVAIRGIREAAAVPTGCVLVSRLAGTDYSHASFGLTTTASNNRQFFALDPAGNAWTEANVNAIEYGALSS